MEQTLEALRVLDRELVAAARGVKVLTHLAWPLEHEETFLAAWRAGRPRLPAVAYPRLDLSLQRLELERVAAACDRGHPVARFLARTAESYAAITRLIEHRGSPDFGRLSIEIYGSPDDPIAPGRVSTAEAARHLLDATSEYIESCAPAAEDYCLTAETVAQRMRVALAGVFGADAVDVVVDAQLAAKAAAGAGAIRIRGGTCYSENDVDQLVQHEAMVHTLTARNGRAQTHLTALSLGAPRTTLTQEGLALFGELISNAIDLGRLRRIASRSLAIHMALGGADFVEVFRWFHEQGQSDKEAYASAARVFRGGDVRGGVAFTKDGVYLQGFVRVHEFFRSAIHDNRVERTHRLMAGRLTLDDVVELDPWFESGLIDPPRYQPDWVRCRSRLAAYVLYSAFTAKLGLERLQV